MRVLIVDGSRPVRERLRGILRDAGASDVRTTASAAMARKASRRSKFEAVLVDLPLGDETGALLIQELRAQPAILVVVVTNDATESHRREWLRRGAHLLFDKSRQFEEAVSAVMKAGARPSSEASE